MERGRPSLAQGGILGEKGGIGLLGYIGNGAREEGSSGFLYAAAGIGSALHLSVNTLRCLIPQ